MRMTTLCAALSGAFLISAATLCSAASETVTKAETRVTSAVDKAIDKTPPHRTMSRANYSAENERIESEYKTGKEGCEPMSGNTKAVCQKEAKAEEKIKKAELEAKYKGTTEAAYEALVVRAKAQREVANEKCESLQGKEKAACKRIAKSDEKKAMAQARDSMKVVSADRAKRVDK